MKAWGTSLHSIEFILQRGTYSETSDEHLKLTKTKVSLLLNMALACARTEVCGHDSIVATHS